MFCTFVTRYLGYSKSQDYRKLSFPSDLDDHFTDMGAGVQILERLTGVLKLKHLVDDGAELDLRFTQKVAKILVVFLCSYCNTPAISVSLYPQESWDGSDKLTAHERS